MGFLVAAAWGNSQIIKKFIHNSWKENTKEIASVNESLFVVQISDVDEH